MRATFQNPNNQLLHGEFVTVKLYSNKPVKTPIVPQIAVQENQEGKFVYILDENDLPVLTYIKVNGQQGDNWIVTKGVKAGDRLITDGIQKVVPAKPVKIVSKEEMAKEKSSNIIPDKKK